MGGTVTMNRQVRQESHDLRLLRHEILVGEAASRGLLSHFPLTRLVAVALCFNSLELRSHGQCSEGAVSSILEKKT